jgi:DNA-binding FadR family transcriptional regulator
MPSEPPQQPPRPIEIGPVQRVRKAYEQVYDQLRELILSGELAQGQRLPNEAVLASSFGVSRGTVREALRVLTAENLVRTAKGAGGGSFVTLPTADRISDFLEANIGLLSESRALSLEEFLEVRTLLEVFSARKAAERHDAADIERLRATIMHDPSQFSVEEQAFRNDSFHAHLLGAARNTLLSISAQPIFSVLRRHLERSNFPAALPHQVRHDHEDILAAVEAGDADAAARHMLEHMEYLQGVYRSSGVWKPVAVTDPRIDDEVEPVADVPLSRTAPGRRR